MLRRDKRMLKYNILNQKIHQIKDMPEQLNLEAVTAANKVLSDISEIPLEEADTDEVVLGGQINENVYTLFQESLPKLEVAKSFTLDNFLTKFKDLLDRVGWAEALKDCDFLRSQVCFQPLNRRTHEVVIDVANKEKKQRPKERKNEVATQASQPSQVTVANQGDSQSIHVNHVYRTLRRIYKQDLTPLEFWPFVVDPRSFENTLENMFSVNILVNDCKVKLLMDETETAYLEPVTSNGVQQISSENKVQRFFRIMPSEYKDLIRKFSLEVPAITPLENSD